MGLATILKDRWPLAFIDTSGRELAGGLIVECPGRIKRVPMVEKEEGHALNGTKH